MNNENKKSNDLQGEFCAPLLLSVRQLSFHLGGRSVRSIRRDMSAGLLPPNTKIGGTVYFRNDFIHKWVRWGCCNQKDFLKRLKGIRNEK